MIVRLTIAAEADLEAIGDTIASDDPRRAVTFVQELRAKCLSLADLPRGFPLCRDTSRSASGGGCIAIT